MNKTKLRISTGNRSAAFSFEDGQEADWHFSQLVRMLMRCLDEAEPEEPEPDNKDQPADPSERSADLAEQDKSVSQESSSVPKPAEQATDVSKWSQGAKGFVYMKCPHCGSVQGTNLRSWQDRFRCTDCGESFPFSEMRLLEVNCECGRRFVYRTNLKVPMFDIPCLDCGNPVAVAYNEKEGKYETIGRK